jgi:dTDP-4-dehydrorhamnose reductase
LKIIGTGLSGLVGSRIIELNPEIQFTDLSLDTGFNILKPATLEPIFKDFTDDVVLHLAAFTDTGAAWLERGDKSGLCYRLNVEGTQNILDLCNKYHKYLICISTDFVFDGQKEGKYTEEDQPKPIEWYGETKYLAEKLILDSGLSAAVVRIAFPYRSVFPAKIDIVRKLISKLSAGESVTMFTDQLTTPSFIDDIAVGLKKIIDQKPVGIYHLVGSSSQSPYDMAKLIAGIFGYDQSLIKPSSLADYLNTPDARPYAPNLSLSNAKVSALGIKMKTLTEGLLALKQQL